LDWPQELPEMAGCERWNALMEKAFDKGIGRERAKSRAKSFPFHQVFLISAHMATNPDVKPPVSARMQYSAFAGSRLRYCGSTLEHVPNLPDARADFVSIGPPSWPKPIGCRSGQSFNSNSKGLTWTGHFCCETHEQRAFK